MQDKLIGTYKAKIRQRVINWKFKITRILVDSKEGRRIGDKKGFLGFNSVWKPRFRLNGRVTISTKKKNSEMKKNILQHIKINLKRKKITRGI